MTSDLDLLGRFARENSQDAFAEIVRRHVDLVYSAALRQVRSPQLAEEITQSVFADLARIAGKLKSNTIVTAWLYAITRRTAIDVIRKESRRQLREQIAVEMKNMNATSAGWPQIGPLLDDAMAALDEADRTAVLLRYFENKSLREVGEALGISEDAAQKRISRAVDRLREFFSKRNILISTSGLVVLISANAVQSAPFGLLATISATTALAGTAVSISTAVATTKVIAMTALQKTIIGTVLIAAIGTGVFEAHQGSRLRDQNQMLQQQQAPLAEQIRQLLLERDDATNQLAGLRSENARLESTSEETELLKLRSEVGLLRRENQMLRQKDASSREADSEPSLGKGFGSLGDYMSITNTWDAGNHSPEALLQTFVFAVHRGDVPLLEKLDAPLSGQSSPGDVAGKISKANAAAFAIIQAAFTNSAGFHLSSKPANGGQAYRVRLDADPLPNNQDPWIKNFFMSVYMERKGDHWIFGAGPSDETEAQAR